MLSMFVGTTDDNAYWYGGYNDSSTSEASSVDVNDNITSVASDDTNGNDGEGASATEHNRRTEGESVYRGVAEVVIIDDD